MQCPGCGKELDTPKSRICIDCAREVIGSDTRPGDGYQCSGIFSRFIAFLIDCILAGVLFMIISGIFVYALWQNVPEFVFSLGQAEIIGYFRGEFSTEILACSLISYLIYSLFVGYFYAYHGATPGKLLFAIEVIDVNNGDYIGFWRGMFRDTIGKLISGVFMIGYIMALFNDERRSLHDLLASSVVVNRL